MKLTAACVLLVLCGYNGVFGQKPDDSACADCRERYSEWFLSRRIDPSVWENGTSSEVADLTCLQAHDIYHQCFLTCIKDASGNIIPFNSDPTAIALKSFLDTHCLDHECRLADTLGCTSSNPSCTPEAIDCVENILDTNGCHPTNMCNAPERQVFAYTATEKMKCYADYPTFVIDGLEESDERRVGLQVCKDVLLIGCLPGWHVNKYDIDFKNFIELSDEFKSTICDSTYQLNAMECLSNAFNGTVRYEEIELTSACDVTLIKESHREKIMEVYSDLLLSFGAVCSENHDATCEAMNVKAVESNSTSELPPPIEHTMAVGEEGYQPTPSVSNISLGNDTATDNSTATTEDIVDDVNTTIGDNSTIVDATIANVTELAAETTAATTTMSDEFTLKNDTETPASPPDADMDNHDGHKHPGPVGKSTKDDKNMAGYTAVPSLILIGLLAIFPCV